MPSVRTTLAMHMASVAAVLVNPHNSNTPKSPENPSTASTVSEVMGPAAFLWPDDRVWDARMDNSPPCGSVATPGNRTRFPLKGGTARLVAQDDYYESIISISYLENPTENKYFKIIKYQGMESLNPGHTCVNLPDPDEKMVKDGTNATLQIIYIADWDTPGTNQTFYACADITYVSGQYKTRVGCFNATEPGEDDRKATAAGGSRTASDSSGDPSNGSSGGSKLSSGALAAAIVSPIVGVSMLAAGLFLYRRKQQQKRSLRLARMEENARREQWPMDKVSSPQKSI